MTIKTPVSWMGNKTSILHIIYALFPKSYTRYIEPFGGSGAVLLGKSFPDKFEVYNDYNANLVNLFRCMRDRPMEFIRELGFLNLNSRDDFTVIKRFFQKEEFGEKYLEQQLMKIHAAMRENQPEIIEEAYEISEILELSESEYASLYQDLLEDQEYFAQRKSEDDAILILGENQNDGILVQTQNKGFAYKSSFIPEARLIAEHHIRQLADYCISEGTQYSENGNWSIPYEESFAELQKQR